MRVGQNPEKSDPTLDMKYMHRVIIPVYIPNLDGYFQDAKKILLLALDSLWNTLPASTAITIINNNSCDEIVALLEDYRIDKKIDCLIHNAENNGKIYPLIAAIRASYEPIITVADADVLFCNDWFAEALKIFNAFPAAGMISYTPDPLKYLGFTDTTLLTAVFGGKMKKAHIGNEGNRDRFALSIGQTPEKYYAKFEKSSVLVIENKGVKAQVGSHHFACTLRRSFLDQVPKNPSLKKITGNSELHYIDKPVDKAGFLKLSTLEDKVFHMGNVWEKWMENECPKEKQIANAWIVPVEKRRLTWMPYSVKTKLVSLLFRTRLSRFFL